MYDCFKILVILLTNINNLSYNIIKIIVIFNI